MSGKRPEQADTEAERDARGEAPAESDPGSEHGADPAAGAAAGGSGPERAGESGTGESVEVDELRQEIESLTDELEELRDRHLRLAAEFDNFRKRTVRERAQEAQRAQGEVVRELLESLDDLARVSREGSGAEDASALLEGVQLVERKLQRTLERSGLKPVDSVGEPFDPELHEALMTVPTDDPDQDGVIAQELAKGYLFKDMLLRPSLVEVKKYVSGSDGEVDPEPDEAGDES